MDRSKTGGSKGLAGAKKTAARKKAPKRGSAETARATKKVGAKKDGSKKVGAKKSSQRGSKLPKRAGASKKSGSSASDTEKKAQPKPTAAPSTKTDARSRRRTSRLKAKTPEEREAWMLQADAATLRTLLDESYGSDVVHLLLDMRRARVKELLERMLPGRKRQLLPLIALYHYKVYLLDPLPQEVRATTNETLPNYYAVLGLPRDAWQEEIDEAYVLLSRAFASEVFAPTDRALAERSLTEIREAYTHLENAEVRQQSDRLLPNLNGLYPRRETCWLEGVKSVVSS